MVRGVEKFREYFTDYPDSYIIIGGTALDRVISEAGFTPRHTDDIDIILVIHALNREFIEKFWQFINDGGYVDKEIKTTERKYYRFQKPAHNDFPVKIELFSKEPDSVVIPEGLHLTPVPVEEGLSDLSAILLDDDYYQFTLSNSTQSAGINYATKEALVCLKAKAYLENKRLKEEGVNIQTRDVVKHKYDIFRLMLLFAPADRIAVPDSIKKDLNRFAEIIENDLPASEILNVMQIGRKADMAALFEQFKTNFLSDYS